MTGSNIRNRLRREAGSLICAGFLLSLSSCGDDTAGSQALPDASSGSGGTGAGGASETGTTMSSGGANGSGGLTSTAAILGGMTGAGGVTGTAPSTGGVPGSGGLQRTGGTRGARTGGATGQAGMTSAGGTTGLGGVTRTVPGSGGVTVRGGAGGATTGSGHDAGPDSRGDASSPSTGTDATYPIATGKPTVYLAGDSTVQTYSATQAPQQGWGQRIAEFFTSDVVFVNKSMGGRSSKSFIDEGRLKEIVGLLKTGDYLFAQWGINDRYKSDPDRYTDPATTFRSYLKQYIDGARSKDAIPVLVTPTPRLDYTNGVFHNGFIDYCIAIKAVGKETNTPVIDLQTMGLEYYTSIGYDAVVETIALPGPDVLHFRDTGAYQMARLVARGVRDIDIPISPFVRQDKL